MDLGLEDKVVLVAAASEGLGAAIALEFGREGAVVVICSRDKERIEARAEVIRQECGAPVLPIVADVTRPSVYLAWQKGIAWLSVIIGILAITVLPPLLTAVVWWILPEEIKSLISGLVNLGMMMLVMWLLMKMMPVLTTEKEKPKQIKEPAG